MAETISPLRVMGHPALRIDQERLEACRRKTDAEMAYEAAYRNVETTVALLTGTDALTAAQRECLTDAAWRLAAEYRKAHEALARAVQEALDAGNRVDQTLREAVGLCSHPYCLTERTDGDLCGEHADEAARADDYEVPF